MRQLTLDEKISIKGALNGKGVNSSELVKLDTKSALWFWSRCFGTPLSYFNTLKMWHKSFRGKKS